MPSVIFHVSGENFIPETALRSAAFKPFAVHLKGERMSTKNDTPWPDSGFSVDLGPDDNDDLAEQITRATEFIDRHFDELKALTGADDLRLDFGYEARRGMDGNLLIVQCDYFPPEFLRKCGELGIGIELSLYGAENTLERHPIL